MRKVLLIFSSALGDFINFLPFINHLNTNFPDAEIHLITKRYFFPIIEYSNCIVHEKIDIEKVKLYKFFSSKFSPENFLFFQQYSEIISFTGSRNEHFRKNLRKLNKNCKFIFPINKNVNISESLYLLEQYPFKKRFFSKPVVKLKKKEKKFVLIHPGSGDKRKNVNIEFFINLKKHLSVPVKFFGGENEIYLKSKIDIEILENLLDVFEFFKNAIFYIGNDSGISHLAAACNILTFVFFGPTSLKVWKPQGENVYVFTKNLECSPCEFNCNKNFECLKFDAKSISGIIQKIHLLQEYEH